MKINENKQLINQIKQDSIVIKIISIQKGRVLYECRKNDYKSAKCTK